MNIKYWMLNFNNWSIWYSFVIYFKQFVIKKMELLRASKREKKAAEQEAKLLSKLRHPNIVSYKDSFESEEGFLYIVMGFCDGGDLYNRLKQQKNAALEERQVVEWFVQIAMALQVRNAWWRTLLSYNNILDIQSAKNICTVAKLLSDIFFTGHEIKACLYTVCAYFPLLGCIPVRWHFTGYSGVQIRMPFI